MHITLSPQRSDEALVASKAGDVLTINGEAFDFGGLPDGASISAGVVPCKWIVGPVARMGGNLFLTLVIPHGPAPSPQVAAPSPLVDPSDGALSIPVDEPIAEDVADVDG